MSNPDDRAGRVTAGLRLPTTPATMRREALWSLALEGRTITASLIGHGESGWEMRLEQNGGFYAGRRFTLRADAMAFAETMRDEIIRENARRSAI